MKREDDIINQLQQPVIEISNLNHIMMTILRLFGVVLRHNLLFLNKDKHCTLLGTQEQ